MTNKKIIILIIASAILLGLSIKYLPYNSVKDELPTPGQQQEQQEKQDKVEQYIKENISTLSKHPAVLGGNFYVTQISFEGTDWGYVEFEDGHIAFKYRFIYSFDSQGEVEITSFDIQDGLTKYQSEDLGLTFYYYPKYFLEVKNTGSAERARTTITLTEDTEENRAVREGRAPGREGPVAITIDVYQNNLDHYSAKDWIQGTNDSNFKLSDGIITPVKVGNDLQGSYEGLSYHWSGLYEADNVVSVTDYHVYSFVVTYLSPEDFIRQDFEALLKTVVLNNVSSM